MNRSREALWKRVTAVSVAALAAGFVTYAYALDGGTPRVRTYNGWRAFEVITQGNNPGGDGVGYSMPGIFDGAGAWLVNSSRLRVQVNHETSDASVSEVDLDVANLKQAIANVRSQGNTGGVSFVRRARQAYDRVSYNGGSGWTNTSSASNTRFSRFCSGQAYAADTFGPDRGFVDQLYITGEEVDGGRLFALASVDRDFYQVSGVAGSAPGGIGGMPFDAWENAALVDTGENDHIALMLSPDGGSERMKLYIGVKSRAANGSFSNSFLARNGLAYGSWYYFNGSLPGSAGTSRNGFFDTSSSGALRSSKLEDIDTSPSDPTKVVLGDQTDGVFVFDLDLVFSRGSFDAGASSFSITKISNEGGGGGSLDSPDNVDWTDETTLDGVRYRDGLIFVNEDNSSGEVWMMRPDGSGRTRIASTTVSAESTGIFDLSEFVGYAPGSILITNNQGSPSSMTVLINPAATALTGCGDGECRGDEDPASCPADCPDVCGDGLCTGPERTTNCPADCGTRCGDGVCNGSESLANCGNDCPDVCGDGVVGDSEDCELGIPLADSCESLGFDGGALACDAGSCRYDTDSCESDGGCGDGSCQSVLYEAEDRSNQSDSRPASNHAGYTGDGFMDYGGGGSWIEWNDIDGGAGGDHTLEFRYANARASRFCDVVVNGAVVGEVEFGNTGSSWTSWGTDSITVALAPGENTVRVVAQTSSGGPNLDHVVVTPLDQGDRRPGLLREHYTGEWTQLPDFDALSPDEVGVSSTVTVGPYGGDELYGLVFSGVLFIGDGGAYDFELASDDGSRLTIDGAVVVDHDGLHGFTAREGRVSLSAGWHELRVEYFERTRGDRLRLRYRPVGGSLVEVPAAVLAH